MSEILQTPQTAAQKRENKPVSAIAMQPGYLCVYDYYPEGQTSENSLGTHEINFVDTFHDCRISIGAAKTLKKSVAIIQHLSRKRHNEAARPNSKERRLACLGFRKNDISARYEKAQRAKKNNFLCTFITLTLPATQTHTDTELTTGLIDPFFAYARKHFSVKYYVWKKELQEKAPEGRQYGNLHFHIVADHYIDCHHLRREWNRLLNRGYVRGIEKPFDYVTRYQQKQKALYAGGWDSHKMWDIAANSEKVQSQLREMYNAYSFKHDGQIMPSQEYDALFEKLTAKEYERAERHYKKQMQLPEGERWTNPNSTDIEAVKNAAKVAAYVAKYISKDITVDNAELTQYSIKIIDLKNNLLAALKNLQDQKTETAEHNTPENFDRLFLYMLQATQARQMLDDARAACPIKGRLWFKSQSLTPFLSGARALVDFKFSLDLQNAIAHLREKEKKTKKRLILEPEPDEVILGPNGKPVLDEHGKPRTKRGRKILTLLVSVYELWRYKCFELFKLYNNFSDLAIQFNEITEIETALKEELKQIKERLLTDNSPELGFKYFETKAKLQKAASERAKIDELIKKQI